MEAENEVPGKNICHFHLSNYLLLLCFFVIDPKDLAYVMQKLFLLFVVAA